MSNGHFIKVVSKPTGPVHYDVYLDGRKLEGVATLSFVKGAARGPDQITVTLNARELELDLKNHGGKNAHR